MRTLMKSWIVKLALVTAFLAASCAQATPVVSIDSAAVQVGDTFDIAIKIANVDENAGLTSWQFDLAFDPTILIVSAVTEGTFLSNNGLTLFTPGFNFNGLISGMADFYSDFGPLPSGSGILATVTFTALNNGVSALTPESIYLNLVDTGFETRGGNVTVGALTIPEPGSLELIGASGLLLLVFRKRRRCEL
jgi:hypothetical protein